MPDPQTLPSVTRLALLIGLFAASAQAQTVEAPPDETDMTPGCEGDFRRLDRDGNGFLSEAEAPQEHLLAQTTGLRVTSRGILRSDWLAFCNGQSRRTGQEDASPATESRFTEAQVRALAIARRVSLLENLSLDASGIWRGQGMRDGTPVSIVVFPRGEVLITPQDASETDRKDN